MPYKHGNIKSNVGKKKLFDWLERFTKYDANLKLQNTWWGDLKPFNCSSVQDSTVQFVLFVTTAWGKNYNSNLLKWRKIPKVTFTFKEKSLDRLNSLVSLEINITGEVLRKKVYLCCQALTVRTIEWTFCWGRCELMFALDDKRWRQYVRRIFLVCKRGEGLQPLPGTLTSWNWNLLWSKDLHGHIVISGCQKHLVKYLKFSSVIFFMTWFDAFISLF